MGIGSVLMHAVFAAADAPELPEVVLLGDTGYYQRFGFRPAESLGVRTPDPSRGAHFQIRTLRARSGRSDDFYYASAFGI